MERVLSRQARRSPDVSVDVGEAKRHPIAKTSVKFLLETHHDADFEHGVDSPEDQTIHLRIMIR